MRAELDELALQVGIGEIDAIPVAAKSGDNVVRRSASTPWYDGPTLLEYLEGVELAAPSPQQRELRLPVQYASRPSETHRRNYSGRIIAGTIAVGDEVAILPSGSRSTVVALDTLDGSRDTGVAGLSVSVELADEIDVARGDVIVSAVDDAHLPVVARELEATLCWLAEKPLRAGDRVALKHGTTTVRATVQSLDRRLDPDSLIEQVGPGELVLNDIGTVTLRTSSVVLADRYAENRDGGAFILIDEASNETVARARSAGPVKSCPERRRATTSSGTRVRWRATNGGARPASGATVWLTGLPASGKSTVAVVLERLLVSRGRVAYLIDGDNIRHGISDDLGFSRVTARRTSAASGTWRDCSPTPA